MRSLPRRRAPITILRMGAWEVAGYWMVDFNFKSSFDIEQQLLDTMERNGFDPEVVSYGVNWAYLDSSIDLSTIVLYSLVLLIILMAGYLIITIFSILP